MSALTSAVSSLPFKAAMAAVDFWGWQPFRRGLANPMRNQTRLLKRILAANAATVYGRRYGFDGIRDYSSFQSAVPVCGYEDIRPLVMQQIETDGPVLTAARSLLYARTSGTTGAPKLLPITGDGFDALKQTQRLFALRQYQHAETFTGRILAIAGPGIEDRTSRGVPIGSASGAVYAAMPWAVRCRYVIPPEILTIADYDSRDYAIALLGLASDDVSAVAAANPSTLVRLRQVIHTHWDQLSEDVRAGRIRADERIDPGQRAAIDRRLRPNRRRAAALARLSPLGDRIGFDDIWPGLNSVVTWTGGSCGYALGALRTHLPPTARIIEAGYHASECRGTLNIDPRTNACVPSIDTTFFEFVERDAWECHSGEFLTVDQLQTGRHYHVFVTTADGLYRYDMNDIVRVTGKVAETPTLEFVQKGSGVTSITGEKLTEAQVLAAATSALRDLGIAAPFFLMLADEANAVYRLLVEGASGEAVVRVAPEIDALLMTANIEYAAKRKSGRLQPPTIAALRAGAGDAYRRHCVAHGQRDAQFKVKHLQYRRQVDFDVDGWSAGEAS
jgi:GH3 auxin-responsive promoter